MSSKILAHCPTCNAEGLVSSDLAGQIKDCPKCRTPFELPGTGSIATTVSPKAFAPRREPPVWLADPDIRSNLVFFVIFAVVVAFFGRDWLPASRGPQASEVSSAAALPASTIVSSSSSVPGAEGAKLPLGSHAAPSATDGPSKLDSYLPAPLPPTAAPRRELPLDCPASVGVRTVAFTPDGRQALTIHATNDGGVFRRWDLDTGLALGAPAVLPRGDDYRLAFSSDGFRLGLSLSPAKEGLLLLNPAGAIVDRRDTKGRHLSPPAWGTDGTLFFGTEAGTVESWRTVQDEEGFSIAASTMVTRVACSIDGAYLIAGDAAGELRLVSIPENGRFSGSYRGFSKPIRLIESGHYDGGVVILAAAGEYGDAWQVQLIDLATLTALHSLTIQGAVMSLAATSDLRRLVAGTRDGHVTVLDVATGTELERSAVHRGDVTTIAVAPDGGSVLTGCYGTPQNHDTTVRLRPLAAAPTRTPPQASQTLNQPQATQPRSTDPSQRLGGRP